MPPELYRRYRPTMFKQLVGQPEAAKILLQALKNGFPHATLMVGPSGTGKTTAIRILKDKLGCSDMDFAELNTADFKGVDTVRDIRRFMGLSPMGGKCRIYALDECHKLTNDAQSALLKMTEDTPDHVYFMLATTDPGKLLPTLRKRCTQITFKPVPYKDLQYLLNDVAKKAGIKLAQDARDKIAEVCDGSARDALVRLGTLKGVKPSQQLNLVAQADLEVVAFDLVKALMPFKGRPVWLKVANVLDKLKDQEAEGVRQLILKVCSTHMLKGGLMAIPAFNVYQCVKEPLYANKWPGLVGMCFDICHPPTGK